ncbi:hypothetical protein GCK32_011600 [Trichostrongylus colubriformis]|uniref:Uncharacterized protein n=1 Tax=Trichostrongylus colubriformis TaxID=6319 RepID=A0AAN8IMW4_TRICO
MWISYETNINRLAHIGDCPLLAPQRTNTVQYETSRPFEKWWIFQTGIMCLYCILMAHVNYDDVGHVTRATLYIFLMAIWIMNVTQTIYTIHRTNSRLSKVSITKDDAQPKQQAHVSFVDIVLSKDVLPAIVCCLLMCAAFVFSIIILNEGHCIHRSQSVKCEWLRSITFALLIITTLYSLTIAAPLFIVMIREHTIERQLMKARIRLAVFHFLHHLLAELKISPDLFCSSAYKVARREAMSFDKLRRFTSGTKFKTEGKKMWFLRKGVCKITEWLPSQEHRHYHDMHVSQGAFVGERNILKTKWRGPLLPLMWPKRRYETTTYCEMLEINEKAIQEILAAEPSIYTMISNEIQSDRLITELRHSYRKRHDITPATFWTTFQRCGKSLTKEEQLTVPEGRIGIVGCWTQITLVAPRSALDGRLHVKGPAKLWVQPADVRAPGMVYFEKIRIEDAVECGGENNSCISFIHDGPGKLRALYAA